MAPVTPYVLRPPKPKRPVRTVRLTASTLLLLASVFLAVSLGLAWWSYGVEGGGVSGVRSLLPGSSLESNGNFGSGAITTSTTYVSSGLIHVGELYETVLGVGLMAALAGFVAVVLSYLGAFGTMRRRTYLNVTLLLVIISFASAVALPVAVAVGQPSAFNADGTSAGGGGGGCGASPNPCTAFWGSQSGGGVSAGWGADLGWYFAIAAAVLFLLALLQLYTTRREPYTRAEITDAAARAAVAQEMAGRQATSLAGSLITADPAGPGAPSGGSNPATITCPRCGRPATWVPQYSRYYCATDRTYL
jgi:hypothetical protein